MRSGPLLFATLLGAASPAPAPAVAAGQLAPATRVRAGASTCRLGPAIEIASITGAGPSVESLPSGLAFGARGGLVIWQSGAKDAFARPVDASGRPTGPARPFGGEASFLARSLLAVDGGFALVASVFDVRSLNTTYWVHAFDERGARRGKPVQLDVGDFYLDDVSEAEGSRFVVFGGPNQGKALQRARAILVEVSAAGDVKQKTVDLPISAPVAVRPAVTTALAPGHWAILVQVGRGGSQTVDLGGGLQAQTVPLAGRTGGQQDRGASWLIFDGALRPLRGEGAGEYGPLGLANRYRAAFLGNDLVAAWSTAGAGGLRARYARVTPDGQLRAEPAGKEPAALRALFDDQIDTDFTSGFSGTAISRYSGASVRVGERTQLKGTLPDVGDDAIQLKVAWSGAQFVIAYAPAGEGPRKLRTAVMRCDAAPHDQAAGKPRKRP